MIKFIAGSIAVGVWVGTMVYGYIEMVRSICNA